MILRKLSKFGLDNHPYSALNELSILLLMMTVFIGCLALMVYQSFFEAMYYSGMNVIVFKKGIVDSNWQGLIIIGLYGFIYWWGYKRLSNEKGNIMLIALNATMFSSLVLGFVGDLVINAFIAWKVESLGFFTHSQGMASYLKGYYHLVMVKNLFAGSILVISLIHLLMRRTPKEDVKASSGKLGSAKQADMPYLRKMNFVTDRSKALAGDDYAIGKLDGEYIAVEKPINTLVIAPPRSGKGVSAAIPSILDAKHNIFALDIKSELFLTTYEDAIRKGKKPVAIDPYRVLDQYGDFKGFQVFHYDPLNPNHVNLNDELTRDRYIAALAGAMMVEGKFETDHFKETANSILQAAIDGFLATGKSLTDLYDTFAPLDKAGTIKALESYQKENKSRRIVAGIGMLKKVADKEAGSILSTLYRCFDYVASPAWARFFSQKGLSIQDYVTGNSDLYLIIPEDMVPRYPKVIRMILSMLATHLSITPAYQLHTCYPIQIDEVAQLGPVPEIPILYEIFGAKGVRLSLYFQSVDQVDRFEKADMIKGFDLIRVFGANDTKTIEWIQKLGGRQTIIVESRNESTSKSRATRAGLLTPGNVSTSNSTSEQETATDLYHTDVIRELDRSKQFVFKSGMRSFICDRIFYYDDQRYKGRFGINYVEKKDLIKKPIESKLSHMHEGNQEHSAMTDESGEVEQLTFSDEQFFNQPTGTQFIDEKPLLNHLKKQVRLLIDEVIENDDLVNQHIFTDMVKRYISSVMVEQLANDSRLSLDVYLKIMRNHHLLGEVEESNGTVMYELLYQVKLPEDRRFLMRQTKEKAGVES
ncbi:type IV secretory system conjugative DNA transfer family protein [Cysteiniphilum litorale]|uniref:type IV secretory system conjugative DNA transfer family protein n=1 Tax=Cysteiniphilum litorale TaxID=2056700 RepID=UPI003F88284D